MNPETIAATAQAFFQALTEIFRFLNTEAGQAMVKKSMEDREAFDKWVKESGQWIQNLLTGKL